YNDLGQGIIYVNKYRKTDGALLWSRNFVGSGDNYGRGIAVDAQDNVLVTGYYYGVLQLQASLPTDLVNSVGDDPLVASPNMLLAKFDAAGNALWANQIGSGVEAYGTAIAVDQGTGASVITGYFMGTMDFGNGVPVSSPTGYDCFVAKYDSQGN